MTEKEKWEAIFIEDCEQGLREEKVMVKEITLGEWNKILFTDGYYFCNGCIFEKKLDNLVAFSLYEDALHVSGRFYRVVKE